MRRKPPRRASLDEVKISGGSVTGAAKVDGRGDLWELTVAPSGVDPVTFELSANRACTETGAVCTADGRALSADVSATVPGPTSQTAVVSVGAVAATVTEGSAAVFTLTRIGSLTGALTVNVEVSETEAMLKGAPPSAVTLDAGSATAELSVETEDDEVAEPASAVTAALKAGSGYSTDSGASSAAVTVEDDDAAPVIADTGPFTVDENETPVTTLAATDGDTPDTDLAWSIAGGADAGAFTLGASGDLAFAAAKDFEAPDDADQDGDYEITARVTDGANPVEATV